VSVLEKILAQKRADVEALRAAPLPRAARDVLDVRARLARGSEGAPLRLLAEIKRRSPSAGPLSTALSPAERALAYARAGATMISVLCDRAFFDGGWDHLQSARVALDAAGLAVPLLAKEFVIDEAQLDAARAHGADAVLLIARIVSPARLAELAAGARERGLEPLVEVAEEPELEAAAAAGARVVGVNARDLDTLVMDAARAARVLAAVPEGAVRVHLSGVKTPDDVRAIARARVDAALVGEALMREDDPSPLLSRLVAAAAQARG
jgi:indole-3-glycerol phosphate synthase